MLFKQQSQGAEASSPLARSLLSDTKQLDQVYSTYEYRKLMKEAQETYLVIWPLFFVAVFQRA
jgi:hypothetical protein